MIEDYIIIIIILSILNDQEKILAYDFEDELEFWSILGTKEEWDSKPTLRFCMFDNESGNKLKDIDLGIAMEEVSSS